MAMSRTRKIVLVVVGIIAALAIVCVLIVALLYSLVRKSEPAVASNSVLVLKVQGEMADYVPDDPLRRVFGGDDSSLSNLLTQIKKAKVDKRIGGLLLEISFSGAGWGKADEIRDAIADFRTSGKPAYAYMEYGANKEYYIATSCEKIFVTPGGDLFINGLAADVMFFRGSLDKLGIEPDVFQIGKYKNAPDQFTRKEMSEAHREVIDSILDDIFNRYKETIATARKKTPEEINEIIDNAPIRGTDAKARGLIDDAIYRDQVNNEFKKRLGYKENESLRITNGGTYRDVRQESLGLNQGERIALIYASGTIGSGKSNDGSFGDQSIGSDTLSKAVNDAAADNSIKAIVIRVDSPGGSSYASDIIWHAIEEAKKKKPIVISMSDVAASGGYYIACNANKIVAEPSTITGSIGIFAGKPVLKGFYDWLGISNEYVLRGKLAGMFRETEKFSPEERAKFESMIKSTYYDEFVPKVAQGRGRDREYIDSIGQGRVWMGDQGKANGLVDEFGGLDRAIEIAKGLANIPAEKGVQRVIFPYPRNFFEELFDTGNEASVKERQQRAVFEALPEDARRALRYAAMMDRMKRGEMMALMPFELTIK